MKRRDVLALGLRGVAIGGLAPLARASRAAGAETKYPDRPIKLVVPFVAGGVNDIVARLWADRVRETLGTVYIENQGGAGGLIGAAAVMRAPAISTATPYSARRRRSQVLNPIALSKPLYDPIKDFEAIAILALSALTIVVTPALPVHTLKELIAYDKAHPGKLVYGSAGTGTMTHLAAEMFKSLAKACRTSVTCAYKGTGASLTDVMAGQVPMIVANITGQVLELNRSGKLRMLVTTGPQRLMTAPSIPTAVEAGLPGMISTNFTGLFAPARTPPPLINQIAAATRTAMAGEEVRANLTEQGLEPSPDSTPERTRRFVEEDIARWSPVVRSVGLKLN